MSSDGEVSQSALAFSFATVSSAHDGTTLPHVIVKFGDLDISTSKDAAALHDRIQTAAVDVCSRMYVIEQAYRLQLVGDSEQEVVMLIVVGAEQPVRLCDERAMGGDHLGTGLEQFRAVGKHIEPYVCGRIELDDGRIAAGIHWAVDERLERYALVGSPIDRVRPRLERRRMRPALGKLRACAYWDLPREMTRGIQNHVIPFEYQHIPRHLGGADLVACRNALRSIHGAASTDDPGSDDIDNKARSPNHWTTHISVWTGSNADMTLSIVPNQPSKPQLDEWHVMIEVHSHATLVNEGARLVAGK